MESNSINIKIEQNLKEQAQQLFASLGMDMTTAVNIFLRQAVREQAIPCRIGEPVPNQETIEALAEVQAMKANPEQYPGYTNVDQMMEELLR